MHENIPFISSTYSLIQTEYGTLAMKVIKANNNTGVIINGNDSKNHEIITTLNVKGKRH